MSEQISYNWPGNVWIFSDPHFGDEGILKYERTEFLTHEEHDAKIVKMINSQLQEGDTLVCLGDLGRVWKPQFDKIKKCAKKVLVMGNHDGDSKGVYRQYFDEIYSGPVFASKFVILSHEPIPVSDYFINVHGHLHNSKLDDNDHINLGYKCNNFTLFNLKQAHKLAGGKPRIKAHFLEEWYADKYVFIDKLDRRNCFLFKDTGHVVPKGQLNLMFNLAKTMIYQNMIDPQNIMEYNKSDNVIEVTEYKQKFDEYFSDKFNRYAELYSYDNDCANARKIYNAFVYGMGIENELLPLPDKIYGVYWFYTYESGRLIDRNGALIELENYKGSSTYEISKILIPSRAFMNGIAKIDETMNELKVDGEFVDLMRIRLNARNFKDNHMILSKFNLDRENSREKFVDALFFMAPDEQTARLEYELKWKGYLV